MEKNEDISDISESAPSFIPGHTPKQDEIQFTIGPYQVLRSIGQGGMGEVLLVYDTNCGRRVAIKKIRADLLEHKQLHSRFLKEARITAQLTHPAIMPIYAIQEEKNVVYYTMPFVQGETLKQILRKTRDQEKEGKKLHHLGGSIPALIRVFITVCQAIAYAHSKGVLHRDLKPENIMIGEYGEVLILDWGLAKLIEVPGEEEGREKTAKLVLPQEMTRVGKVVGTVNYMAPERALGNPATVETEIYAFGVILYQILTLRNPFRRGSLEEYRKAMEKEKVLDPTEVAPYRDVPRLLARIAMKCLSRNPANRYHSVDELIRELENYIEGRAEWFHMAELDMHNREDWEFQENVLIAEHVAITRTAEVSEWVSLMISKASFNENTKVEAKVKIGPQGHGVGFLLSIPEGAERVHLNDGYCLWLGSDLNKSTKLLRSAVEVIHAPEIFLERGVEYAVRIEKIDHNIHFYLNDTLQFSYISHLPLVGTHVGLLARDADFSLKHLNVYVGSQNVMVKCLAVPDAFLAHKDYATALSEYRRIGYSFLGRAEGREAMFRAGITILEQAKDTHEEADKIQLYDEALTEFEKLHSTPGAPLEYLGKAHVYQEMDDVDEEIKCYEIGFRRYPQHPLLPVLHEQLIYRMYEVSRLYRKAAYQFMLTALRHLPNAMASNYTKKLFDSLSKHWEPLHFFEDDPSCETSDFIKTTSMGIRLAFWLANPLALMEFIGQMASREHEAPLTVANALFCLVELGAWQMAKTTSETLPDNIKGNPAVALITYAIQCHEESPGSACEGYLSEAQQPPGKGGVRLLLHAIETALTQGNTSLVHDVFQRLDADKLPEHVLLKFNCYRIRALLLERKWQEAGSLLHSYTLSELTQEDSPLFPLYGCWLAVTENREIAEIHFSGTLDVPFPRTWTLLGHYLSGKISFEGIWGKQAFLWEKRQLCRQLMLFYHCIEDQERYTKYARLEQQQYVPNE